MSDDDPGARLLVVDDDPAFARIVRRIAEPLGFAVATSEAETCREIVASWRPAVIVLDLHMPGIDGIEILRQLAADHCGAEIFLASGAVDKRTLEITARLGEERGLKVSAVLRKPVRAAELQDLLRAAQATIPEISASAVAEAIAAGQLFLEYQPKLDCRLRRITGAEALVRWRHPTRGVIAPDRFIPLAECADLMVPLTGWVVAAALSAAAVWHQQGLPLEIAINISGRNLREIELPDRMERECKRSAVAPDRVILELTETQAMGDAVRAMDVLTRLRLKGFKLSIDDFGTGYSSLVQLHRMPFSELKIDRPFVAGLIDNEECRVISETIIALAHKLGLRCVAEGVESEAILNALVAMECDEAQGYWLSRPIAGDRVVDFARDYR